MALGIADAILWALFWVWVLATPYPGWVAALVFVARLGLLVSWFAAEVGKP